MLRYFRGRERQIINKITPRRNVKFAILSVKSKRNVKILEDRAVMRVNTISLQTPDTEVLNSCRQRRFTPCRAGLEIAKFSATKIFPCLLATHALFV